MFHQFLLDFHLVRASNQHLALAVSMVQMAGPGFSRSKFHLGMSMTVSVCYFVCILIMMYISLETLGVCLFISFHQQ